MKKALTLLLCAALLLPVLGCGKQSAGNDLWNDAAPNNGILNYYSFDENGGFQLGTFNDGDKYDLLDRLSAVDAIPVTDWTADNVKLPVYGIEIPSEDGWGIHAAWSDGYLILRDGSVYEFDFDFSTLAEDYEWERERYAPDSLSSMPCGRLLSEGPDGWIADRLSPADELTAPEGITIAFKELTAGKITAELTNSGNTEWCYGEYFSLQALLDGVWYGVPELDDLNYGFTDIGYILPAGESREERYNLSMYGDLPGGTYRLVMYGLSVEFDLPYTDNTIASITDQTVALNMDFPDVVELFFEDENNRYSFGNPISQYIIVRYADGSEEDIKTALESGRADIGDLNRFGIPYWIEPKTDWEITCVVPCGVQSIVDHSLDDPDRAFATALEPIWEDAANVYSFPCIKSQYVTVYYDDGSQEDVKTALEAGRIIMDDLDAFGIGYITEPKA